jgi:hypothetical protein
MRKRKDYSHVSRLRREAEERAARWISLTPKQQIAELKKRPGNSTRQMGRLLASQLKEEV